MDIGKVIFLIISATWITFFLRIPIVVWRTIRYIKQEYPSAWENEFQGQIGTSIFGGQDVFSLVAKINDPRIENFKKQWKAAIRNLVVAVLASVGLILLYIFNQ